MYIIVGLGNPGEEYRFTRHNIGWLAVESFLHMYGFPDLVKSGSYNGLLSEGVFQKTEVGTLLPTTYMNNSGPAVLRYMKERNGSAEKLIVVHDEIDLPFGTLRISVGRGGGGHNGVQSVINSVGSSDVIRVRVGIAKTGLFGNMKRPAGDKLASFVLGTFSPREQKALPDIGTQVANAIAHIIEKRVASAMNTIN